VCIRPLLEEEAESGSRDKEQQSIPASLLAQEPELANSFQGEEINDVDGDLV
jgi:hypothetical protein